MRSATLGCFCAVMAGALFFTGISARAQEAPESPDALLQSAMEYVSGLDALTVDIGFSLFALVDGEEFKDAMKGTLVLRGIEDLYLNLITPESGDAVAVEFFTDGEDQVTYVVEEKKYMKERAESRLRFLSARPGGAMRTGSTWLSAFLHNDSALIEEAVKIEDRGQDDEGRHLSLSYEDFDMELWLGAGTPPLLKRFKANPARQYNDLSEEDTVRLEFSFSDWKANPEIDDSRFIFTPPEGVEPFRPDRGQDDMTGKEAPPIELELLDGGTFNLADHKGKDIVVLDFWASWCGPCRIGLPIAAEVVQQFADKNVVLYAVNLRETPEQVKTFLETTKLDLKVPMDKDGKIGLKYGAESIPRMVIVGKDGQIAVAHTGVSPTMREDLTAELNALIAEKP